MSELQKLEHFRALNRARQAKYYNKNKDILNQKRRDSLAKLKTAKKTEPIINFQEPIMYYLDNKYLKELY